MTMAKVTVSLTLKEATLLKSVVGESLKLTQDVCTDHALRQEYLRDPQRGRPALAIMDERYRTLEAIQKALD